MSAPLTAYYREPNGDYMMVAYCNGLCPSRDGQRIWEGRSAAIEHMPESMATTGIGARFIAECVRVRLRDVPQAWRKRF